MRVVIINTTYGPGGASQIVVNLNTELRRMNVDSSALVATAEGLNDEHVHIIPNKKGLIERVANRLSINAGLSNNGILNTFGLEKNSIIQQADILNLHNLHGGYFNFLALPRLTKKIPAVLTLHDMWPFTGHCVYSFDCDRWRNGCGQCPYPDTYQEIKRDATWLEFRLKRLSFLRSRLHIVAISRWIYDLARESMLGNLPIHLIPNGINLEIYRPYDQSEIRKFLNLPSDKFIILYGAENLNDPRKGFDLLKGALEKLPTKIQSKCVLLIMGHDEKQRQNDIAVETKYFGFVNNETLKVKLFSAADIFAFPTRADNLPVVLQESLACGIPMVSFAVGGVPDIVRNGETGFTSPPENIEKFAENIKLLMENEELRKNMGRRCRQVAEKEFSLQKQAQDYLDLFHEIMA